MDASDILKGEVSLQHAMNIIKSRNEQIPDGRSISTLTRLGIHVLKNLGEWRSIENGMIIFAMPPDPPDADRVKWSNAAKRNWEHLREVMKTVDIRWLVEGHIDLLIPEKRGNQGQKIQSKALHLYYAYCPLNTPDKPKHGHWTAR